MKAWKAKDGVKRVEERQHLPDVHEITGSALHLSCRITQVNGYYFFKTLINYRTYR